MTSPLVSVIVPTYNGARYIRSMIESVLDQTYGNFELIVVDDKSTDETIQIVKEYTDPRIRLIVRRKNGGSDAARMKGLRASRGEIIAFLDQDDRFHRDKLVLHVHYLDQHPNIGLTHNARFLIEGDRDTVLRIARPPSVMTFPDIILGYPISPSDTVMRRKWANLEEAWDDSFAVRGQEFIVNGGEMVFYGRLWMAGCQFGTIEHALNYRRIHPDRILSDLDLRCKSELMCQEIVLSDPRCPAEAHVVRDLAAANIYVMFVYHTLNEEERELAKEFLQAALQLNQTLVTGDPCELARFLATSSSQSDETDHVAVTERVFGSLPLEYDWLAAQKDWAIARGYLNRCIRNVIWDRMAVVDQLFVEAEKSGATIDDFFVYDLVGQLNDYELELGIEALTDCLARLIPYLNRIGGRRLTRQVMGQLAVGQAFRRYKTRQYTSVAASVCRAVIHDPKYLVNRGVLSILARSQMHRLGSGSGE